MSITDAVTEWVSKKAKGFDRLTPAYLMQAFQVAYPDIVCNKIIFGKALSSIKGMTSVLIRDKGTVTRYWRYVKPTPTVNLDP